MDRELGKPVSDPYHRRNCIRPPISDLRPPFFSQGTIIVKPQDVIATFSIVAADPDKGELGVAVQSKFLAVGAVVPFAEAGIGAIATQSYANTSFGPLGLEGLRTGLSPQAVLAELVGRAHCRTRFRCARKHSGQRSDCGYDGKYVYGSGRLPRRSSTDGISSRSGGWW